MIIKNKVIILEPRAVWTAGVAHNPPLDGQASWHQCLTECQRVEQLVSRGRAKRLKKEEEYEPCSSQEPKGYQLKLDVDEAVFLT